MATPASINKKRARELAAINKKLDDILAILDAGENPPEQVEQSEKPKEKPRTKKA
jgi:hypothetical protein